jgi:hypothetical protein
MRGIVIMDATPFYDTISPLRFRGIPDSLAATHVEASECCLIHVDNPMSAKKGVWLNPRVRVGYSVQAYESVRPGVSLSISESSAKSPNKEGGGGGDDDDEVADAAAGEERPWISARQVFAGIWKNRFRRWFMTDALKAGVIQHRLEGWRKSILLSSKDAASDEEGGSEFGVDDERGGFCLINEMQVLVANGWAHV